MFRQYRIRDYKFTLILWVVILSVIGIMVIGSAQHSSQIRQTYGFVLGLILMLVALCTRIIPVDRVLAPGRFLIELMPVMFVPAAAGLIDSWPTLRPMLLPLTVIMVVSTFVVMAAAGHATQAVLRRKPRKEARK